jgi:hypothetical protein
MCDVRGYLLATFDSCVAEVTVPQPSTAEHKERAIETAMKVHAILTEHISSCTKCAQWLVDVAKGEIRKSSFS